MECEMIGLAAVPITDHHDNAAADDDNAAAADDDDDNAAAADDDDDNAAADDDNAAANDDAAVVPRVVASPGKASEDAFELHLVGDEEFTSIALYQLTLQPSVLNPKSL